MSDGHAAVGETALAHQFDDLVQQNDASTFGMWVFLVTEVMFFGGLFAAYTVYRSMYPTAFAMASHFMNVPAGTINTAVLICSSLTVAMSVGYAKLGDRRWLLRMLFATVFLGLVFLVIKGYEWHEEYVEHHVPAVNFHLTDPVLVPHAHQIEILMLFYFIMTGMHAFHMVIGVGLFSWLIWKSSHTQYNRLYYNPVEVCGLYWHFVDIVWIFLFPMLYLIGQHLKFTGAE